jgi:hypothetical protein
MKRMILIASLALALLAGSAPVANGGIYRAVQCHEPIGATHVDAVFAASSPRYTSSAACDARGLGIEHAPASARTARGRFGAWTLTAPAGTQIVRATARVMAARSQGHVPQIEIATASGAPQALTNVEGNPHTVRWTGTDGQSFAGRLACAGRTGCGDGEDAHLHMRRIALTLRDDAAPAVRLGGSLVEPGSRRGTQALEVRATDLGSGVRSISVEVNDKPLQARVFDCHIVNRVATRLQPCPGETAPTFEIATTGADFRQGPNVLRVCASDLGPQATANRSCETRTIRIDNACPLSEPAGSALQARFERSGTETTVPSNVRPVVSGLLFDENGNAVPGARVCIATTVSVDGAQEEVIATPPTGPTGRFEAHLPPGPSREVRIAYWRSTGDVVERFLHVNSKAVPNLRLRPKSGLENGDSVRFAVRIPGPERAARQVTVQAKSDGRWVTVTTGRTDQNGRWDGSYRFQNTTGTRRYAFRAFVGRQPGYPYLPGYSKIRYVTVKGSRMASKSKHG